MTALRGHRAKESNNTSCSEILVVVDFFFMPQSEIKPEPLKPVLGEGDRFQMRSADR